MRIVGGHAVKEAAQRLVALWPVAQARLGGGLDARRDILRAQLLAQVVHIAGLGSIQAAVHCCHADVGVCIERKVK